MGWSAPRARRYGQKEAPDQFIIRASLLQSANTLSDINPVCFILANCEISPFVAHPVPRVGDPLPTPVSTPPPPPPPTPSKSPRGRGKGARGGRKGAGQRSNANTTNNTNNHSSPTHFLFSAWSPLCLPLGGLPAEFKSPKSPLQRLTPRCVRHFLVSTVSRRFYDNFNQAPRRYRPK